MQTILSILQRSTEYLQKKGVPSPKVDAEWLVAHALGMDRMKMFLQSERPLQEEELDMIRPLIQRRGKREPLQYILGSQPFGELVLQTDVRALIPRPETEELIYKITERVQESHAILEMGTGTGAIALSLAKKFESASIMATDISNDALTLAQENAQGNGLAGRVQFVLSDWYADIEGPFDLIVSNPPYLTKEEWESAQPEVKSYEPPRALWSGEDGLADIKTIISLAPSYLSAGGWLFLETGIAQRAEIQAYAEAVGFSHIEILTDFSHRDRYVCARR